MYNQHPIIPKLVLFLGGGGSIIFIAVGVESSIFIKSVFFCLFFGAFVFEEEMFSSF